MLILGRKPNQSLIIGSEITITVLSVEGNQIKLGIDAPKDVAVLRDDAKKQVKPDIAKRHILA